MASKKVLELQVILKAFGVKATTKQIEEATQEFKELAKAESKTAEKSKKLTKEQNKLKRAHEGLAQRSGRAGKDFSRMQQGMGGLIQAYATVAAHVFALSSAFLLLRRAADLSSMMKSAEDFSSRFGVSVSQVTKRMQEASGGALDFAEALPSINKAISAGVGIEQMEKLTQAATKASQTFGGTTTEALNRFISASQRGRVEIIQTLGVVIKTEDAYRDYAAAIGKTALELTAFDRQQAILNATIEASQKVFDGVNIDPNPFTQFASTVVDVKNELLTAVTDGLTPFINTFNQSRDAAKAFMAFIASIVAGKIFPQITGLLAGFSEASIKSTVAATAAMKRANVQKRQAVEEHNKTSKTLTERGLRKQLLAEEKSYAKRKLQHKSFKQSIFKQNGEIDRQILNQQRAALARQEKALISGKGITKTLSTDLTTVRRDLDLRNRLATSTNTLNVAEKHRVATLERTTTRTKKAIATLKQYHTSIKAVTVGLKSGIVTGFSKEFATMQTNVSLGLKKLIATWRVWNRSIGVAGVNSLKRFSEAFGRTVGFVAGGLSRIISKATSFFIIWSLGQTIWEIYGDRIKGITKAQRELLNSFSDLGDAYKEINRLNEKYLSTLQASELTLSKFIKEAEFLRGVYDSLTVAANDLTTALFRATGKTKFEELVNLFPDMQKTINNLKKDIKEAGVVIENLPTPAAGVAGIGRVPSVAITYNIDPDIVTTMEALTKNSENFKIALEEVVSVSTQPLIEGIASTISLLEQTGFDAFAKDFNTKVLENFAKLGEEGDKLRDLFNARNWIGLTAAIQEIAKTEPDKAAAIAAAMASASQEISTTQKATVGNFVASGKALEDVNRKMGTYLSGLEKARAASVPNKEVFNLLLDAERALNDLSKAAETGTKNKIKDLVNVPDLEVLRDFLNIGEDLPFADALDLIQKEIKKYDLVIQDTVHNTGRLKIIQNEIFKLKNEEASTDFRRVQIIRDLNKQERKRATLLRDTAQHQLDVARIDLARLKTAGETETEAFEAAKAKVKELNEEVKGQQAVIDALEARKDAERELLEIKNEIVDTAITVNKLEIQRLSIAKTLSATDAIDLRIRKKLYSEQRKSLKLEEDKLALIVEGFKINEETEEQDRRKKQELTAQLDLIRQQRIELERRNALDLFAETREQQGLTIFSEQGLSIAAAYFINEVRDKARNLKTTFQILGQGFVKVINDSFDFMVENLLEGGKDFGFQVVETIKAGLRDVFGEALKTKIREAFAAIFEGPQEDPNKEMKEAHATTATALNDLEDSIDKLDATIKSVGFGEQMGVGTESGFKEKIDESFSDVLKVEIPSMETILKDLLNVQEETKTITEKGFLENIKLLGLQLIELIKAGASAVGGFFASLFGAAGAMGGMLPGKQPMAQFATGGIAKAPQLALIGEGNRNEAVVPLPNNREIPVDLKGSSGDNINIEQHFDFRSADSSAIPILRQEARRIGDETFNRVFAEINKGGKYAKISGRRR